MTPAEFVAIFPEFSDPAQWPTARVQLYLTLAATRMNADDWGDAYTLGTALFTAHYLATGGSASSANGTGAVLGEITSKKIGEVQVQRSVTSNRNADAGWWNSTGYGRQWWDLFRMFGVGVVQLI